MTDALGRSVRAPAPPRRMVSLVPSQTELLFRLGCGDRVVGVSDYCVEPAAALATIARVGGQKDPDVAAVLALRPDLILVNKEENLRRDVEKFTDAGVPTFVTDVRTVEAALQLTTTLGVLCGADVDVMAALLSAQVDAVAQAHTLAAQRAARPRVLAAVWRDPWIVAGPDTYMSAVLSTLGADNAAAELGAQARYPKLSIQQIRDLRPDRVLLPTEPYPFCAGDAASMAAELGVPVAVIDGPTACWYGPRTAHIARLAPAIFD